MKIDMEVTTEQARENMYKEIDKADKLTSPNVVKASQELDPKILEDMLKQDPKIENSYLKRVQVQQNETIKKLQNELNITNERLRLAKDVVKLYQQGFDVKRALTVITAQAVREGIL